MTEQHASILGFDEVQLAGGPRHGSGLRSLTFLVGQGDLALVESERHEPCDVLFEAAIGQYPPGQGVISFRNVSWAEMTPDQVVNSRADIGRVFAGPAWVSNLNVDENIYLSARHHRLGTDEVLEQQALDLASRWGLKSLPRTRPSWTPPRDLQVAQWIRALLVPRALLLLQLPAEDVSPEDLEELGKVLGERREAGTGVVCLTAQPDGWIKESITPGLHFKLRGTELKKKST